MKVAPVGNSLMTGDVRSASANVKEAQAGFYIKDSLTNENFVCEFIDKDESGPSFKVNGEL